MRKHLVTALGLVAMSLLAYPTRAEDGHRELGPHVHGHGTLNIAIEDKRVSMELEVPGMDIVGFEHAPSTDDQKAAVEKAKARLEKPLGVFSLPAAAGCTVAEAKVAVEAEHDDHGDDDRQARREGRSTTMITSGRRATTSSRPAMRSTAPTRRS